jgi:hypothetical protein
MRVSAGPPEVKKHKEDFSHLSEDSRTKIDQTDKALDRIDECLDHLKLMAFVLRLPPSANAEFSPPTAYTPGHGRGAR